MAWRKIEDSKLTAIANSIRNRLASTETMTIDTMPSIIDNIGTDNVPSYWESYLKTKATEVETALNAACGNRSAFLWYTDAHWVDNYGKSPMLLKYLNKYTGMNKTFFGGDIAQEKSGEIEVLRAWQGLVKDIANHHSVIGNHDNAVSELPTAPERADFFFGNESSDGVVYGTDATNGGLYYYIDNAFEKTRYICLSTGRMWTVADEVPWCINALNSTPEGWHIVIIGHLWLNYDYDNGGIATTPEDYIQNYLDLFDEYNRRGSGITSLHSASYEFANAKAKIEFIIGGHIHQDYDFTTSRGIPVILTECDTWGERDSSSTATQGTTTENCVYAIVADYAAKKINVINVGRGHTRSITIPDRTITNNGAYTNWAKLAYSGADMAIYNGKGYKDGVRVNSSGVDTAASGWDSTGFIPAGHNDIIRFKNCKVYDMTGANGSSSAMSFKFYDESFAFFTQSDAYSPSNQPSAAWSPVHNANGDLIQVTIPNSYNASIRYVRITMDDINEDSIITVNEIIDPDAPDTPDTPDTPVIEGNLLPTAINFDGTILNADTTPGYAANKRYSSSNNALSTLSGTYATGLIPCTPTSTIYMKNISTEQANDYDAVYVFDMNDVDGNGVYYKTRYKFSDILSNPDFKAVIDDNGMMIEFTFLGWQSNKTHFAICSQDINSNSIITVDTPISSEPDTPDTPVEPDEPEVPEVNYTNWIKESIGSDGLPYNGGKGYKENCRFSSGNEVTQSDHCVTGFIPVKSNDILRFANLDYLNLESSNSQVQVAVYNTDFSYRTSSFHAINNMPSAAWSPVYREDGNIEQMTFPSALGGSSQKYIRICAHSITDNSVITINEEIE